MRLQGMKASELIRILQEQIKEHGDCGVYSGGADYPDGVSHVSYIEPDKGNGYVPGNTFWIV